MIWKTMYTKCNVKHQRVQCKTRQTEGTEKTSATTSLNRRRKVARMAISQQLLKIAHFRLQIYEK